ncbi:hypothetical protein AAES_06964 [Amazona aestiva]|uniref:Uncharacterized protein n=1 Tax=Amazona aestiva TaxID=12930 RepID=A0A0Q3X9L1_AMAAE|nr:hypothetical protein AAES_06964 [Amazona aestiva]
MEMAITSHDYSNSVNNLITSEKKVESGYRTCGNAIKLSERDYFCLQKPSEKSKELSVLLYSPGVESLNTFPPEEPQHHHKVDHPKEQNTGCLGSLPLHDNDGKIYWV